MNESIRRFARSMLCPQDIRTNRNTDFLRLLACLFMVIDHAGKMLFPGAVWMRLVGRMAFPLFAYGIAVGAACTKHPAKYLERIAAAALISQPLYAVALAHENAGMYAVPFTSHPLSAMWTFYTASWQKPSILLSLFAGLVILLCLRNRRFVLAAFAYVLCLRFSSYLDYGAAGILLMILFYLFLEHPLLSAAACGSYMVFWSMDGFSYTLFGLDFSMRIFALPAVLLCALPMARRMRLPRWFSYGFYPAHLLVLFVLVRLFA